MKKLVNESIAVNENIEEARSIPMYLAKFEQLCQQAANNGIEFEVLQDVMNQALAEVDWEYAAEQVEKSPYALG